jgi:hypothetical protein
LLVGEEFLGGGRAIRTREFSQSEIRIESDGLLKMLEGVMSKQAVGEVLSLEKLLLRFVGLGGDGDLPLGGRGYGWNGASLVTRNPDHQAESKRGRP